MPIPILYCMNEVYYSNETDNIEMDYYLRDNLHLSSQSKVRSDDFSQSTISRNKPLVMFVGSNKVQGKSTLLSKMYPNQTFSIFENSNKSNPLHESSVDIIYLSDRLECNYHILDVHGKLDNPYFMKCTNNEASRLECIVNLASLCHCIVLEITRDEIPAIDTIEELLSQGAIPPKPLSLDFLMKMAQNILKFYLGLKVWLHTFFPSVFFQDKC